MKKSNIIKIAIIIMVVILLLFFLIYINRDNGKDVNKNDDISQSDNEAIDDTENIGPIYNPDASPESNPSIQGEENISKNGEEKENKSDKIKEEKTVGVYTFHNIKITGNDFGSVITADITSVVTIKTEGVSAVIKLYDKDGKLVSQMDTYIPQVKPGETTYFRTETSADITNAYDLKIEIKK